MDGVCWIPAGQGHLCSEEKSRMETWRRSEAGGGACGWELPGATVGGDLYLEFGDLSRLRIKKQSMPFVS